MAKKTEKAPKAQQMDTKPQVSDFGTKMAERAMLVNIRVSMPGNSRKDKKLTDEVLSQKAMGTDAGKWLRQIYPKTALEPINKIQMAARVYHYDRTLPWMTEGSRVLPTRMHMEYCAGLRDLQNKFHAAVNEFCDKYPEFVEWAKEKHGAEFNPNDYPGAEVIRRKFKFDVACLPFPTVSDFRCKLADDIMDETRKTMEEQMGQAMDEAKRDLFERLAEPIRHMAEKLKTPDGEKGGIFRDSLVGNIREICGMIPELNVFDDAKLEEFRKEVETTLGTVNADTLRENAQFRADTASKADEILAKIDSQLAGYY